MNLIKYPDPRLHQRSEDVTKNDLVDIIASVPEMTKIMNDHNGVGLAAVQVGVLKRYAILNLKKDQWKDPSLPDVLLIINPIIKSEEAPVRVSEGCLSLPRYDTFKERPSELVLSYLDYNFAPQEHTFNGLIAQCIAHEIDHMNGELLIDDISKVRLDMWVKSAKKRELL